MLVPQVPEVRRRLDRAADHPLQRLRRRELAPVPVQALAEPLPERAELAALDLLVQVRQVLAQRSQICTDITLPSEYVGK